jgi:N-acetylmuramoyl-L-alanine amidase
MHSRSCSRRQFLEVLASIPLLVSLPSGLWAATRIDVRRLRHWPDPEKTRLVFDLDQETPFEARVLRQPHRVLLSLPAAALATSQRWESRFPRDPLLERVVATQGAAGVEIVIELSRAGQLSAFRLPPNDVGRGHRIVLDIAPELTPTEQEQALARVREVRESGDRIIAIDPGHGGEDPGTVWGRSLREKEIALDVGQSLARQLATTPGLRPVLTRDADFFIPLGRRQALAKQYGAHVFVSLHVNAARSRSARGAEIFFLSPKGAEDKAARELVDRENAADLVGGVPPDQVDAPLVDILMDMTRRSTMRDSQRLAETLLQRLGSVQGGRTRGIKQGPLAVLKSIDKPSVLVELGFFTNADDRKLLANSRTQRHYAEQLARGIRDFLA